MKPTKSISGGCRGRGAPFGKCCRPKGAQGIAGDEVTLDGEGIVDRGVGGDEALGLALGLEALHLALSSSDRKMRVLHPIVVP